MGYLEDICLGKFHFVIAKMLRETIFINSILLNSEAWYDIKKNEIEVLEKIDSILLKKIFELPSSTPSAFLHLELGTIPIRFVLMIRRLTFLQYILKERSDSLIHSFLLAQIENTLKGDWWETVQNDIIELNLNLSLYEIQIMSEELFRNKVKTHATTAAFVWLKHEKERSKKLSHVQYSELSIQNYLKSEKLNVQQRKLLTHFRSKMVKVKANYSKMYECLNCELCLQSDIAKEDNQEHLLICRYLSQQGDIDNGTDHSDIYSEEQDRYERIVVLLEQKLKLREKLLRNKNLRKPGEPSKVFCDT